MRLNRYFHPTLSVALFISPSHEIDFISVLLYPQKSARLAFQFSRKNFQPKTFYCLQKSRLQGAHVTLDYTVELVVKRYIIMYNNVRPACTHALATHDNNDIFAKRKNFFSIEAQQLMLMQNFFWMFPKQTLVRQMAPDCSTC